MDERFPSQQEEQKSNNLPILKNEGLTIVTSKFQELPHMSLYHFQVKLCHIGMDIPIKFNHTNRNMSLVREKNETKLTTIWVKYLLNQNCRVAIL